MIYIGKDLWKRCVLSLEWKRAVTANRKYRALSLRWVSYLIIDTPWLGAAIALFV